MSLEYHESPGSGGGLLLLVIGVLIALSKSFSLITFMINEKLKQRKIRSSVKEYEKWCRERSETTLDENKLIRELKKCFREKKD